MLDHKTFRNKDLVSKMPLECYSKWSDLNKYEAFLDILFRDKEYQKLLDLA